MAYKKLNGWPTIWPAEHRPWWKRLIYKVYVKYVGEAYLPQPKEVTLVRQKQKTHPQYNEITHIVLHGPEYKVDGTYIFGDFGTKIVEHK